MKNFYFLMCLATGFCISGPLEASNPWKHLPLSHQIDSLKSYILKINNEDMDSTIVLSKQLRQIADKTEDDEVIAFSIQQLAWAHRKKKDLSQSIRYYFELESVYQQLEDLEGLGRAYLNIGKTFADASEYDKALQYLQQAKDHYEMAGKPYKVGGALYEMAIRYIQKKDPDTATDLLFEALEVCPKKKISLISMIYNRLGHSAKDNEDYTKAREYYQRSLLPLDDSPKWDKKWAIANNNIGESYLLEGQLDSAEFYLNKAMAIKEKLNDPEFSMETLIQLANLTYKRGHVREAIKRINQGISKIDPTKLSGKLGDALALFTSIANDPANKNVVPYATLISYMNIQQQQFLALQDLKESLDKSRSQFNVRDGLAHYSNEQKRRILKASMTNQKYTLGGMVTVGLIAAAFIVFVFIKKHKHHLQQIVQEKNKFVRDLISEYDHKIIQLLIVKAEYEEILGKRKEDPGYDDDDDDFAF